MGIDTYHLAAFIDEGAPSLMRRGLQSPSSLYLDDDDQFGSSVSSLPDLDGDEVPELAVGAPFDDDGGDNRGAVYILFLNSDGTVKALQKISSIVGFAGSMLMRRGLQSSYNLEMIGDDVQFGT